MHFLNLYFPNNCDWATQWFLHKFDEEEIDESYWLFMEFLDQINKCALSETKTLFIKYKSELQKLYDNKQELSAVGLFELITWAEHIVINKV